VNGAVWCRRVQQCAPQQSEQLAPGTCVGAAVASLRMFFALNGVGSSEAGVFQIGTVVCGSIRVGALCRCKLCSSVHAVGS